MGASKTRKPVLKPMVTPARRCLQCGAVVGADRWEDHANGCAGGRPLEGRSGTVSSEVVTSFGVTVMTPLGVRTAPRVVPRRLTGGDPDLNAGTLKTSLENLKAAALVAAEDLRRIGKGVDGTGTYLQLAEVVADLLRAVEVAS